MIVGIDPGKSGGLAMLDVHGDWISGIRMPVIRAGKRDLVDVNALDQWLRDNRPPGIEGVWKVTAVEAVHAMPGQGVSSMFNFGRHAGAVEAWAMIHNPKNIYRITPRAWKGYLSLSKDKRASLELASKMWPTADINFNILRNDGIAEAGLVALYYLRRAK